MHLRGFARMAFNKNMVMTNSQYKIEFAEQEVQFLDCPRCGHTNPRKARTNCEHCAHFIPHDEARQDWTPTKKSRADLYGAETSEESKDCKIKLARKSYGWMRQARKASIVIVTVMGAMAACGWGLKTYMGEAKFNKLDKTLETQVKHAVKKIQKAK